MKRRIASLAAACLAACTTLDVYPSVQALPDGEVGVWLNGTIGGPPRAQDSNGVVKAELSTLARVALGVSVVGGAVALNQGREDLRTILLADIGVSALTSALGILRGSSMNLLDSTLVGSAAGLTMFGGKAFLADNIKKDGYWSALGTPIHEVGASVRDNLFLGQHPLSRIDYGFGPLLFSVTPQRWNRRTTRTFGAQLQPDSLLVLAYLVARDGRIARRATLKTGTPFLIGTGGGNTGWSAGGIQILRPHVEHDVNVALKGQASTQLQHRRAALVVHETIHRYQRAEIAFSGPDIERWMRHRWEGWFPSRWPAPSGVSLTRMVGGAPVGAIKLLESVFPSLGSMGIEDQGIEELEPDMWDLYVDSKNSPF